MPLRARLVSNVRRTRAFVALVCLVGGCGSGAHSQTVSTMPPASAVNGPRQREATTTRTACIEVSIGLDFRALPTDTSPAALDLFVRGEIDDFRRGVAPGVTVDMRRFAGSGSFTARFPSGDRAACDASVATYLANAPQLPLVGTGSAASVSAPCGPCS